MQMSPDELYSKEVLSEEIHQLSTSLALTDPEKGRRYLKHVQDVVVYKPELFEAFCQVLEEHGHGCKDLIQKLRGESSNPVAYLKGFLRVLKKPP